MGGSELVLVLVREGERERERGHYPPVYTKGAFSCSKHRIVRYREYGVSLIEYVALLPLI